MRTELILIPDKGNLIKITLLTCEDGNFYEVFGCLNDIKKYHRSPNKIEAINKVYRLILESK
ncbi:hypothetical protein ACQCVE_04505 [Metabacillus sp. 113a]|uniref:hypothetical protein n=1 Tax=Metabacillus sp. 113a TaxID=3404706 RepID=UPI003CE6FA70